MSNAAFTTPGPYLVIRDFLGADANRQLLDYVSRNRSVFRPSTVVGENAENVVAESHRISTVMKPDAATTQMFRDALVASQERINSALSERRFAPGGYEIEIAAHNDGAFFSNHIDTVTGSGRGDAPARIVSGVYYFFRQPARFTGGALRLCSIAPVEHGGAHVDIVPENDMLLCFPSMLPHEVLPVACPSGDFMDSRFAVNCWATR